MKKLEKIYLFLSIIFFIVGVIQCCRLILNPLVGIVFYGIILLPAILFFGLYFFSIRKKQKYIYKSIFLLCLFTVPFWVITNITIEILYETTKITQIDEYNEILKKWEIKLVGHFPKSIPLDAQNIKFSFSPIFLQGGKHIQLRYSTSTNQIENLYTQFSKKKEKILFPKIARPSFHTGENNEYVFSQDYEILFMGAESCDPKVCGFRWNHGESFGVAISKQRNEIIYWAESW